MKARIFYVFAFIFHVAICSAQNTFYISTTEALKNNQRDLKNMEFFIFPELREKPIIWYDSIPQGKIGNKEVFNIIANPNEYYVFQLGVWAIQKEVKNIRIEFSDFKTKSGKIISTERMTCFNCGGIDFKGDAFSKKINIPATRIQALWLGIDLEDIAKETYYGSVTVFSEREKQVISIQLDIIGESVQNHGYNEGYRLSRLNWLNSTVGIDEDVTKDYVPIQIEEHKISILGREFQIAKNGLPSSITSFFDAANQSLLQNGENIVERPFRFIIEKENGRDIKLVPGELTFIEQTPSKIVWKVINTSDECSLEVTGQMEFDGYVAYNLKLTTKSPINLKDIRLEIPVVIEKAEYMMGLGHEGGKRAQEWKWKWDISKNQDMLWLGAVNGGMRIKWKAENYVRPLVNIYYEFSPLNLPPSWGNDGKGGVDVSQEEGEVVINAYSGARELNPGEKLNYDFELLITPFRTINRNNKFCDRYYHGGGKSRLYKIKSAKQTGANIINIHHAEDIYPFINYPYLDEGVPDLKKLVADAHDENMRMKFYYTTRELTKNIPEFWAFNSLDGEIIFPGPGNESHTEALHPDGPDEWLVKNMREKYIPAWYSPIRRGKFIGETDLSVITTPDSRLNNFYVAGLDWMIQNMSIDGVYIDDSALDRFTLRRARKIIDKYRPEGRIDLHSWNHFNKWAGFTNCLNLYMDLLPYLDLVWIGESRDYNRLPDHWLVEISGIPFGLPGQMLEGGGNPWRGMVYGITNRAGWTRNSPEHLWKFFDEYNFSEREMIGYWDKKNPLKTNNPNVKASIYKSVNEIIIAIANWADRDEKAEIIIDWPEFEIDKNNIEAFIPEIIDFQLEQTNVLLDNLVIPAEKGFLIVLKNKQ